MSEFGLQNISDVNFATPLTIEDDGSELTISEMASMFDVTLRTLRFYEEKGLVSPRRSGKRRFYSRSDHARMRTITRAKRLGLPLETIFTIIEALENNEEHETQLSKILNICLNHVDDIQARQDELQSQLQETMLVVADLRSQLQRMTN